MKTFIRKYYRLLLTVIDFLLILTGIWFSFFANLGTRTVFTTDKIRTVFIIYSFVLPLVTILSFWFFNVYKVVLSNFGVEDVIKISSISLTIDLIGLIILLCFNYEGKWNYIWSWLLATVAVNTLIIAIRVCIRFYLYNFRFRNKAELTRTLVVGAGACAKIVSDESKRNKKNHNNIILFVDDSPNKIGCTFLRKPVKGPIKNIRKFIEEFKIEEVIIAIASIDKNKIHEITDFIGDANVRIRRMPLLSEMEGPNDTKVMDVNLDELLCRAPVQLDNSKIKNMLNNQIVLVTGAGGSIGSELVRQIFTMHPKLLILFDIYENGVYEIQMELVKKLRDENIQDIKLVTLIGSTYNEKRVEQIIKKYKPDYIYHAAAYKHVPLMEDSPAEAIRTNVIGTYNVAKTADKYSVKKMVLVSTDKAVRPTNVMGATKRFAETIIQYYSSISKTKYAAVRFGNVLGSNGSVVPLFKKQIESGGPITITDKEIVRYFMTIPEAVALILQCGLFAEGGEIFILDMGKPVKIISLAERLIRQAGLVPYVDINIIETGLRPGEKLFEELLLDTEHQKKTENNKIFIEEKELVNKNLETDVKESSKAFDMDETSDVKKLIGSLIKTYTIDKK